MRRLGTMLLSVLVACAISATTVYLVRPVWYVRTTTPLEYPRYIRTHSANHDLPPTLVAAVIRRESDFDDHARSHAGAVGLMQLTPKTARGIALRTGGHAFQQSDLLDPELNIRYGTWYLAHLDERLRPAGARSEGQDQAGDPDRWVHALAAYNAGQGNVQKWIDADDDHRLSPSEIRFAETRHYVETILEWERDYRRAYGVELRTGNER